MNSSVTESSGKEKRRLKNRKQGLTGSNSLLLPFGKEQLRTSQIMMKERNRLRLRNHFKCYDDQVEELSKRNLAMTDKKRNHNQELHHFSLVAVIMSMLILLIVPTTTTAVPLQFVNQSNNISSPKLLRSSVPSSAILSSSFDTSIGEEKREGKEGNFINNEFGSGE